MAGWDIRAYCLTEQPLTFGDRDTQATLVAGMKWLLGTYTLRFNGRHWQSGHVFAGRYRSLLVDGKEGDYLRGVSDYVYLNPVRAGLVQNGERLEAC